MDLEYAFLADAAQVAEGKLYVIGGGFDRIFTPQFPALHPSMVVVLGIKINPAEYGRDQKFEIYLTDSDGKRLGGIQGGFHADAPTDDPVRPTVMPIVFTIARQKFEKPGRYAVYVLVNNEERRALPLELVQIKQPSSGTKQA